MSVGMINTDRVTSLVDYINSVVAGLRLAQLPVERHVMSARWTSQPADSQLSRHRCRRAVAAVAPDLYRCCLDKHILHITVYDVMCQ